jgi:U4/U6.U5 tri-snRNP-associated protein 3
MLKGKPVEDNHVGAGTGAVSKHKARKYRQYMNRKGGFNRPLDKV